MKGNNLIVIYIILSILLVCNLTNAVDTTTATTTPNSNSPLSFLVRKQFKYDVVLGNGNSGSANNNKEANKELNKEVNKEVNKEINKEDTENEDSNKENEIKPPTTTATTPTNEHYNSIKMTSKDGTQYKCLIPKPVKQIKEKWIPVPTVDKIKESLSSIKSKCIKSANPALWWSYEFCYHDKVRQMHVEKGELQSEFILGVYVDVPSNGVIKGIDQAVLDKYHKREITEFPHVSTTSSTPSSNLPYFSEQYEDGTQCELLNIKRRTEVRYYCSKDSIQPTIQEIGEPSSCTYLLKVLTNKLCIHPLFQPKVDTSMSIVCDPI